MRKPQSPTVNARPRQDALIRRPGIPPTDSQESLSARSSAFPGRVAPPARMQHEQLEFPPVDPNAVRLAKLARIMNYGASPNDPPELIREAAAMQARLQNEGGGA